jgi:hypothetical protein
MEQKSTGKGQKGDEVHLYPLAHKIMYSPYPQKYLHLEPNLVEEKKSILFKELEVLWKGKSLGPKTRLYGGTAKYILL